MKIEITIDDAEVEGVSVEPLVREALRAYVKARTPVEDYVKYCGVDSNTIFLRVTAAATMAEHAIIRNMT